MTNPEYTPRAWGYSLENIKRLERERNAYRYALNEIAVGNGLNPKPPRDIRSARRLALKTLMGADDGQHD